MIEILHRLTGWRRPASCFCVAIVVGFSIAAEQAAGAKRTVRVGVYQNEPKIFIDQDGHARGLFIDLIEKIGAKEGWTLDYVPCEWEQCLAKLEGGQIDLMPDVAYSPERDKTFDFNHTLVVESWSEVFARHGLHISQLSDLNGLRVAVLGGSIQQTALGQTIHGFGYRVKAVKVDSLKEAFQRTANGSADVAIANKFFGDYFYRAYGLVKTPILFGMADLYYAAAQGRNADLLKAIDRHLGRWVQEPQSPYYDALQRLTLQKETSSSRVPRFVYWLVGVIVGLLAAVSGVVLLLRTQVRSRTKHLQQALETQKESEQRFRRLAEEWQTTLDATGDAIWILDADQRIVRSNKAGERLFGLSGAELIGKHSFEIVHGTKELSPESPFRMMRKSLRRESGEIQTGERWFTTTADPILNAAGDLVGAVGIAHDITERKRAEEEREKLEAQLSQMQRIEAVGRLAGGVAHDFNNMLNIILGYGEMVLARLKPEDPSFEDVKAIVDAGKRSAALTRALLAFSRQQTLQAEAVDLEVVVKEIEKMLRSLVGEDIELEFVFRENVAPVMADPGQMAQVIMNLAINARDAMPEDGKLTIGAKNVALDESGAAARPGMTAGKYVMLSVTDTGCGMEKEVLGKIFEPFFTTKEKGKGTGLGLASVYGVVKQSGGGIYAYSEPGKGSTFEVYLPPAEARSEAKDVLSEGDDRPGSGEHILLVEDEAVLRKLLEEMLIKLGYRVAAAASGKEALLLVEEKGLRPDLVLTDVVMPGMDGVVLAKRLRKKDPTLKVLYMSGYAADTEFAGGAFKPGTLFIEKPIGLSALSKKLREAMRAAPE